MGLFKTLSLNLVITSLSMSFAASAWAWTDRAQSLAQKDFSDDSSVQSLTLDGQAFYMFKGVLEAMNAFSSQTSVSQDLKTTAVSEAELLANPVLIYRARGFEAPSMNTYSSPDGLLNSVFGVLSKVEMPLAFEQSELKVRVNNALRKIHRQRLLRMAQGLAKQNPSSATAQQALAVMNSLYQSAESNARRTPGVFPELNANDRRALSMFLGGFLWRFRGAGGYDNLGTNDRRSIFVQAGFASIALLNGASAQSAASIGEALRSGVQWVSWGAYHDMGRLSGDNKYSDFANMTEVGRGMTRSLKSSIGFTGSPKSALITLAGGLLGSCYYYSWEKIPSQQVGANLKGNYLFIFGGPTNFGEFCSGAGLGLAISEVLQK